MTFTVRPIDDADFEAVNALHGSVGWPRRSLAGWRWLKDNPAGIESGAPSGWLLEAPDGRPSGHTGNFVQRFHRGGDILYGATGYSIIVAPHARGHSRPLLRAFSTQAGMVALYTFNANPRSAPLYKRHGLTAWPLTTHDVKLSWRIDTLACAGGRLWREIDRRAPHLIDPARERLLNPRLGGPAALDLARGVSLLSDLDDRSRFGDFWTALRAEGRLIADRSPATLRWRLADPDLTLRPLLLAYNRGKAITGYAMAVVAKGNPIEPPMLEVIDLIGLKDEPRAIPALMQTLLRNARSLGAAKVRIQVVNEDMIRRLGPLAASARREGGWGHCHARFAPDAEGIETWTPTPFDADYGICLRPAPVISEARAA